MTNNIILLALHVVCAVFWAMCSINTDKKSLRVPYVICTVCWSICIGVDIAMFALM